MKDLTKEATPTESIELIKGDQSIYLGEITKKTVNESRRALFEIYQVVANDPALEIQSVNYSKYIEFNKEL
ncbi:MAG: hypothetical protein HC935_06625 [Pseudanabaena sp. SU_2_4]|nr:hypothetical protein [Pseudanabaena sp. SU_2_4]